MSGAEVCRNCRFSKSHGRAMLCRRYPPDAAGKWGNVHPEDWCGEWMAMRPGAGLPAEIAPPPTNPRNRRSVVRNPPKHRVEVLP